MQKSSFEHILIKHNIDRCMVLHYDGEVFNVLNSYIRDGLPPALKVIPVYSYLHELLKKNKPIQINHKDIPPENDTVTNYLKATSIKSSLMIPTSFNIWVSFSTTFINKAWEQKEIGQLRKYAEIFSKYEDIKIKEVSAEAILSKHSIGRCLVMSRGDKGLKVINYFVAPGIMTPPKFIPYLDSKFFVAALDYHHTFYLNSNDSALPEIVKTHMEKHSIKSTLFIPVGSKNMWVSFTTFDDYKCFRASVDQLTETAEIFCDFAAVKVNEKSA
jgi:hypothetical protein